MWQSYLRRLRIWETDYGRDAGWEVWFRGEHVANLTDCHFEEMFWDSYRVEAIINDAALRQRLATEEFWLSGEPRLKSREFGDEIDAIPAARPFWHEGRVTFRLLYLNIQPPKPWDHFVLWIRGRRTLMLRGVM